MRNLKYKACDQWVCSCTDGQKHKVKAEQLIALYNINPSQCVVYDSVTQNGYSKERQSRFDGLIDLKVQYNGVYDLKRL